MKNQYKLLVIVSSLAIMVGCRTNEKAGYSAEEAKRVLALAEVQYENMYTSVDDKAKYPRSVSDDGTLHLVEPYDWTSGFFPGSLWYLYEYTGNPIWKERAETSNAGLEVLKTHTETHDLGFMLYCSFGNGLRLTENDAYVDILIEGAHTLASRYNENVECIKSWDWGARKGWDFPVIIDNMMNLEYLMWAANITGDTMFKTIAVNHSNTTLENHFRPDHSSFHVVDFDSISGEVRWKGTHQGYADESAWARGQAWGFYGYTFMYRETRIKAYLEQAKNIADFVLNHPNLPADYIPYWDLNAPDIPNTPRDVSAAAIMASGLIELSQYVNVEKGDTYLDIAEKMLKSLSSEEYLANKGENNNFILKHSVGNLTVGSEVDTPLNYADYYFIEALIRYINLVE